MSFLSSGAPQHRPQIQRISRPVARTVSSAHKNAQSTNGSDATTRPSTKAPATNAHKSTAPVHHSAATVSTSRRDATNLPHRDHDRRRKSHLDRARLSQKRKSASPSAGPLRSDSEGDSDVDPLEQKSAPKRQRRETSGQIERTRAVGVSKKDYEKKLKDQAKSILHSADVTGSALSKKYKAAFENMDDSGDTDEKVVSLQYPSPFTSWERFSLLVPSDGEDYRPLDDLQETIKTVLAYYLPGSSSLAYTDEAIGIPFRLSRALRKGDRTSFLSTLKEYNDLITTSLASGEISSHLASKNSIPQPWLERVLDQIYARTVGPQVDILRQYEAFSSFTYGELRPPFISQIFRDTNLTSSSVFLDMGSGIGNVVLQAALEVGCESHGIEYMKNPSGLAAAQASEFPARTAMWGLNAGRVQLWRGDFLEDTRANAVLSRADVVLVNNQAFQPDLNDSLIQKFLDLKEGARVVSLKSFVPTGWKLDERRRDSIIGMFEVERKMYWSGCVSWKGEGGEYFVATKDAGRIERILGPARRR